MGNWKDMFRLLESHEIKDEVITLTVIAGISAQSDLIRAKDPEIVKSLAKAIILQCKNPSHLVRAAAIACVEKHFQKEFAQIQQEVEEKKGSSS